MSFDFDAGDARIPSAWECAVRDSLPDDHTDADFYAAARRQMERDMWDRKKPETVMKQFRLNTPLLTLMSEEAPYDFAKYVASLAERLDEMMTDEIPAGDPVTAADQRCDTSKEKTYNGF